jgi:hypothetical protein
MNEHPPIRDRFLESARTIVPSDDAWERLQQRLVESKRRRRLGRAAVVVTSLALSLGTLGFFAAVFLIRQAAPPARQPVLREPRAEIAVTTHIAGEIQSVAASSSRAWVATIDRSSRCTSKILRVNATGTRTRLLAEVGFDVESLATGGGVIWASGVYCRADGGYSGVVARIDPDGLVSFTLVKHAAATDDIEYFADSVWVAVEQGQGGRAGEVLRVDPERRRLTGSLRFDGVVGSLSPGAGVLWVGETQLQAGEFPTYRIVSVDPTTLEQGAAYDVEAMGSFLPAGDVLWGTAWG